MPRHAYRRKEATGRHLLLAAWACRLLRPGPVAAQDNAGDQVQELRRQLAAERAARKALTYQADMRRAAQLAEAEDWSTLRSLLGTYQPPAGEPDVRSWEWHFLDCLARKKQLVDREEAVLQGPTEGIHQLAWSGNGERLAAVGEEVLSSSGTSRRARSSAGWGAGRGSSPWTRMDVV